jgi:hypothetical protein
MRARNAWLDGQRLYVGNDWFAAARTCGVRYSEYSQRALGVLTGGTPSTHRGYSEYSQGVLRVLTGVLRVLTGGTRSTHRGYSECSPRVLRVLTEGTLSTHRGYSEYSQGVLTGVCPQLRVRAARGKASLSPDDRAGPTPLTAPPRRAYLRARVAARLSAHAHVCVRPIARPTHVLFVYYHMKYMAYWYLRMKAASCHEWHAALLEAFARD